MTSQEKFIHQICKHVADISVEIERLKMLDGIILQWDESSETSQHVRSKLKFTIVALEGIRDSLPDRILEIYPRKKKRTTSTS